MENENVKIVKEVYPDAYLFGTNLQNEEITMYHVIKDHESLKPLSSAKSGYDAWRIAANEIKNEK